MPYTMPDNIPDYIKGLPEGAQRIFVEVFNATLKEKNDEDLARQAGWGAVKTKYEKQGDKWVQLASDRTLRYVAMIADMPQGADGKKTTVTQVFRTGTFFHRLYGKFTITDNDLKTMEANFRASRPKPPTEMVVDYEHMSALGAPEAPAAGWVKDVTHRAGELLATIEWTDKAAGLIAAKEYRFVSPEWTMNYKDKETNKDIGPCLLSVGLTNRPFFEGMRPVMMSEKLEEVMIMSEKMLGAEWDTATINDFPDGCFAYIAPGGEKDASGKTVPRSLRYLPYRNADGAVDLPHLRNALARLSQTDLLPEAQAKARSVLEDAAAKAGVGEAGDQQKNTGKENTGMEDKELRKVLAVDDKADITATLTALMAKAKSFDDTLKAKDTAEAGLLAANAKLTAIDVEADVTAAVKDGKVLPKQVAWAKSFRAKDPEGFKSYLAVAAIAGPDGHILGSEHSAEEVTLTATEISIGEKMGVSKEKLLAQKKADAAKR
jgi:phage I-like protein/cation transport regulator ChaB